MEWRAEVAGLAAARLDNPDLFDEDDLDKLDKKNGMGILTRSDPGKRRQA